MSDNDDPWITINEAAAILGLERSGVYRKAKRGDYGPIQTIGGTQRPLITLVKTSAIENAKALAFAIATAKANAPPRPLGALTAERLLADDLATELEQVVTSGRHTCTNHLDLGRIDDLFGPLPGSETAMISLLIAILLLVAGSDYPPGNDTTSTTIPADPPSGPTLPATR